MSSDTLPCLNVNEVVSALDAQIAFRKRKVQGPPLEGIAAMSVWDLQNSLPKPWASGTEESIRGKMNWLLSDDSDDLDGRTFKGPAGAKNQDPNEKAPMGYKYDRPLRTVAQEDSFQEDYFEGKPRLIDVLHPKGFGIGTDCELLRTMDAIVTILHYDSPALLKVFFALPFEDRNDTALMAKYDRFAGVQERLDLKIERQSRYIYVSLYEKVKRNGVYERKEKPFVRASYNFGEDKYLPDAGSRVPIKWAYPYVWGPCYGDSPWNDFGKKNGRDDIDRDRRLARYLLLLRPWEKKPAIRVKRTIREQVVPPIALRDPKSYFRAVKNRAGIKKTDWESGYTVVDPGIVEYETILHEDTGVFETRKKQ